MVRLRLQRELSGSMPTRKGGSSILRRILAVIGEVVTSISVHRIDLHLHICLWTGHLGNSDGYAANKSRTRSLRGTLILLHTCLSFLIVQDPACPPIYTMIYTGFKLTERWFPTYSKQISYPTYPTRVNSPR